MPFVNRYRSPYSDAASPFVWEGRVQHPSREAALANIDQHESCAYVDTIETGTLNMNMTDNELSLCDAAATLWEHVLSLHGKCDWLDELWDGFGTASIRYDTITLSREVHEDWLRAQREHGYDQCFDWDFVPRWWELNVEAGSTGPVLKEARCLPN